MYTGKSKVTLKTLQTTRRSLLMFDIYIWNVRHNTHVHMYPPDRISDVCSLTGKYISRKHFTYRPVQIFKIMLRRFSIPRIWSSAQDHALLVLLLNLVGFFISTRPRWSGGNDLYRSCTSFQGASRGGHPLNIVIWFIGAGRQEKGQ